MKSRVIPALLLAGLGGLAQAQTAPPAPALPAGPALSSAPSPEYKIAPGDVVSVTIANFPEQSVKDAVVTPDGNVSLPLINTVSLDGQTQSQAGRLLESRYKTFIRHPSVTVSVVQKHPQLISYTGALFKAGSMEYRPGMRVLDGLAEMGGETLTADGAHAVITHADGSKQPLDLSHPENKSDSPVNVALAPGDVVYVPEQLAKVTVLGEVKEPGVVPYKEHLTVAEAITDRGSFIPDTADLANSKLTRNGKDIPLDLDALLRGGNKAKNFEMEPGDQILIPLATHNRTYVLGSVQRTEPLIYRPGLRVQDAVGFAAPTPDADLSKVNLIRRIKGEDAVLMTRVNLNDFLLHGNIAGNPLLQQGDSLYIPSKHKQFQLSDIFTPLQAVGAFGYATRVVQGRY
jgi:polysaccharide export outer membrane protein